MSNKTLLVMAGGTGGHVFPGLAVADTMRDKGWQVSWLGTKNRMEAQLVPKYGYEIDFIDVVGVRGNGFKALLMAPIHILKSFVSARKVLKKRSVNLVLGMGGFASGPGGLAAWSLGIPVILHEQNAVAGLTNRILSRFAKKVLMGFSGAFNTKKAVLVGNPVRKSLLSLPIKKISSKKEALKVLVVGGSLGAKVLNDLLPSVIADFDAQTLSVLHQSGKGHFESLQRAYREKGINADVQEFINDMGSAYAWADVIICRAGALTVAEVAVVGLPAIFVPLPYAVDDHQTKNAQSLVTKQGALLLAQKDLSKDKLSAYLSTFSQNRELLSVMAKNAKESAIIDATERVAIICEETLLTNKKNNSL
ncbi:UDP-N-acetylglucosamine-N-acetylmuramyl- (pentapeptide) pyrophosphoryl-undecaprenol N- acetylglucosamine transferase [Psychromonas sp. CNPT3]|uniref:undecaprenyldiphospho-muramoylpentapeptide beta-N-acetylglucosaminyltransferase n=1 Tax=Psychromonas sp. CNPT3 TaxID=314282 RepID=UPI00006E76BF|nr:undecaprenyldiphospho-muramoylpentapeptide beta-N-acetylglucosaminyltransferase [Psychromonas sp. CNPT3]AGH80641.1 UDP-N-acetylglucosamine-N-acetylmuramyl- (pentapeptide) pyrophosphoryl-undecaprenol N- acetylglucosamine transferase [Psychromonas sp. CNPT3]